MSKRSRPRASTASLIGTGISVTNELSAGLRLPRPGFSSEPRATTAVLPFASRTGRRWPRWSAKPSNRDIDCAFTFGWKSMSRTRWTGGLDDVPPRQAPSASPAAAAASRQSSVRAGIGSVLHQLDVLAADALEEAQRLAAVELRIRRLDRQE